MMRGLALVALLATLVYADGGMVVPAMQEIQELGQVAVIKHFDRQEELSIATGFYTRSTDLGWILPVPSLPSVDSVSGDVFSALETYTLPLYRSTGLGCRCSNVVPLSGKGSYGDSSGVREVSGGIIGDYEYRVLQPANADTLAGYLRGFGFTLPSSSAGVFDHYLQKSWDYFVVTWLHDTTLPYYSSRNIGIRLTFANDSIVYPLHISRIGAVASGVVLYVLADHRQMFRGGELMFSGGIDSTRMRGFPELLDRPAFLTKLYKFYEPDHMEDITLQKAPDDQSYREILTYGSYGYGYATMLAMFALFGMVLVIQTRRARRRQPGTVSSFVTSLGRGSKKS